MIEKLKSYNWTATVKSYVDDRLKNTSIVKQNTLGAYFLTSEGEAGYLIEDENHVSEVSYNTFKEEYEITTSHVDEPISHFRQSFDISRACFDKSGTTYIAKLFYDEVDAFINVDCAATTIDDLKIKVNADSYVFTNIYDEDEKVEVTFSDFGSTILPFENLLK